tara:strand:+ start:12680 stop:12925 length:246 start_codon:yes stop_codon:yes gene_type:complete
MRKLLVVLVLALSFGAIAKPPTKSTKSKFYDFSDQLIDGEIRKPTGHLIDSRDPVKFGRLLRLKKSLLPRMFETSKEKLFK